MTVAATNATSGPYAGNGLTRAFPFTFEVMSAGELQVLVDSVVQTVGFTVIVNSGGDGGTVTFDLAPASGTSILLSANPDFSQDISFLNAGAFLPEVHEQALDRAALRDIRLRQDITDVIALTAADRTAIHNDRLAADASAHTVVINTLATNSYRTKADALADLANIADGAMVQVFLDESKSSSWSIYRKAFGTLEYLFSVSDTLDRTPVSSGIFFDTTAGDAFTGSKISVPTDASLTTASGTIAFLKTGANVDLNAQVKDSAGNIIKSAFTDVTVDFTATVRPFDIAGANGVTGGFTPNDNEGKLFGGALRSHGGGASLPMTWVLLNGAGLVNDGGTGPSLTGGIVIRVKTEFLGDLCNVTVTYPSASPQVVPATMLFVATSYQAPVLFGALGLNFSRADMTITSLKVSASYPNAKYSFLGDSLTQGRMSTNFAHGFSALIRADHPGQVMIAAAPSAQTSDWKTAQHMQPFCDMRPKYAFVMLGTNDLSLGRSLAAIKPDYTSIINALIAADITPIVLAVPPKGDSNVPTFNAWLAAQGWRFVDTYTPLLGTGTSLNATYNSGDGIHPNDAGHAVIHSTIAAYITAQGL